VPPAGRIGVTTELPYAEPLLECLGGKSIDSIDNSNYEGCTKQHDMNEAVPEEWHESYDLVYDGGALEHIFNVPQVLANYMQLARVGGHLIISSMANNYCGHGLYQFSPEFFYRALAPANGYVVERLALYEFAPYAPFFDVPDPASIRSRIELSNEWLGVGVLVLARRTEPVHPFARWPQQSDYSAAWAEHAEAAAAPVPSAAEAPPTRGLRGFVKENFPAMVRWKHRVTSSYPTLARWIGRRRLRAYHQTHSFSAQPDRFFRRAPTAPATAPRSPLEPHPQMGIGMDTTFRPGM